jgi:hypothetical protein
MTAQARTDRPSPKSRSDRLQHGVAGRPLESVVDVLAVLDDHPFRGAAGG